MKSAGPAKAARRAAASRTPVLFFQAGVSGHAQAIGAASISPPDQDEIPEIPTTLPSAVTADAHKAAPRAARDQRPDPAERETFLFFQPGGQVSGGTKVERVTPAARSQANPAIPARDRSGDPRFLVFQPGRPQPAPAPAISEPARTPAPAALPRVRKRAAARPGAGAKSSMIVFQPGKRATGPATTPAPAAAIPKRAPAPSVSALARLPAATTDAGLPEVKNLTQVESVPEQQTTTLPMVERSTVPPEPQPRIDGSAPVASVSNETTTIPLVEAPAQIPVAGTPVVETPPSPAPALALDAPQRAPAPVRPDTGPGLASVDAHRVEVPLEVAIIPKPKPSRPAVPVARIVPRPRSEPIPAPVPVVPPRAAPRVEPPTVAIAPQPEPRPRKAETARSVATPPQVVASPDKPIVLEPIPKPAPRPAASMAVVAPRQAVVHSDPAPVRREPVRPTTKTPEPATVAARPRAPEPEVVAVAVAPAPRTPPVPEVAARTSARPKPARRARPAPAVVPARRRDLFVEAAATAPPGGPPPVQGATAPASGPVALPAIEPQSAPAPLTPVAARNEQNADAVRLAALFQEGATPLTPAAKKKVDELIESDPGDEVSLTIRARRSKVLRTKRPLIRTVISDPSLIEMVQFGPREFALIGKAEGTTNVTLWFDQENSETLTYLVTVLPDNEVENRLALKYKEMERMINALFPNSKIRLLAVGDKIIIRGQARDIREATNIYDLVKGQYAKLDKTNDNGKANGNGANDAQGAAVTGPLGAAGAAGAPAAATIGAPPVANMGAPPVGATGLATTVQLQANAGGGGYGGGDPNDNSNVINMIEVPGEAQVMLKVRIAEVKRTALRAMGSNFVINPVGAIGDFFFRSSLADSANPALIFNNRDISALVNALTANNTMKILAEPNLVTLSGRPATFLSGGSFPVPTAVGLGGIGAASTFFQGYGTQLFFLPTILDKDRIRLQVTPSMSSLDRATTVNGIPGLTLNTAFTTVDLREGQWLAIAGLLVDRQNGQNERVPVLGDIPAVKVLFANKQIKREETELIVLVSPVLIHPLEPKQAPALLPGMDITEPDNWDFYINNRWEGRPDIQYRSTVAPVIKQRIRDARHGDAAQSAEGYYIQGPSGFSR